MADPPSDLTMIGGYINMSHQFLDALRDGDSIVLYLGGTDEGQDQAGRT